MYCYNYIPMFYLSSHQCICMFQGHRFRSPVNVLKCIDSSIATPSLILNLYHDEEGYSIILCTDKGNNVFVVVYLTTLKLL